MKATFKTGSFGVVNPSLLWEQKLSENVSASLSTEYMYTTGKYKFTYAVDGGYDTTAVRRNGDVNALRAEGGLYGKIKSGYWRTKAYFYNSERGYPGAVVRNRFSHEDRQWDTNFFFQSSFKKDFGDVYSLLLNAKYAYDYLHYLADPQKEEATMYVNNTYRQQEVYLSMANRVTLFPFWDINISADYQWNKLNANLTDFPYPRRNTALVAAATSLHFERFKLQASVLGTFVNENVASDTTSAGNKMEFTPTVITSYKPFKNIDLSLRAFYKRIFRMPTLNDLYYTFIGNIKLKPEYTNQYNVGFTYQKLSSGTWLQALNVQLDAYYNEVENKIIATPTNNFFRWTMINMGLVKIKGAVSYTHLMSAFSIQKAIDHFDTEQMKKWCSRLYNKSGIFKYIYPFLNEMPVGADGAKQTYPQIYGLKGSLKAHRNYFIQRRYDLKQVEYGYVSTLGAQFYQSTASLDKAYTLKPMQYRLTLSLIHI